MTQFIAQPKEEILLSLAQRKAFSVPGHQEDTFPVTAHIMPWPRSSEEDDVTFVLQLLSRKRIQGQASSATCATGAASSPSAPCAAQAAQLTFKTHL